MNAAIGFFARIAAGTVLLLFAATVAGCGGGGGSSSGPAAQPDSLVDQLGVATNNPRIRDLDASGGNPLPIQFSASLISGAPAVTVIVSEDPAVVDNNPYAPGGARIIATAPNDFLHLATLVAWYDSASCNGTCLITGEEGPGANPPTRFAVRIFAEWDNLVALHDACIGYPNFQDPRCLDPQRIRERFENAVVRAVRATHEPGGIFESFTDATAHGGLLLVTLRMTAEFNWTDPHSGGSHPINVKMSSDPGVLIDDPGLNGEMLDFAISSGRNTFGEARIYSLESTADPDSRYAIRVHLTNHNYVALVDPWTTSQQRSLAGSDVRARLGESFAGAGAFGDAFGVAPSTESVESRLRGLSDGGGGNRGRGAFGLWEGGDENGRGWVSLGRVDRNFGVLGSGDGFYGRDGPDGRGRRNGWEFGDAPDNPFAALVGDGFAAGGESRFNSGLLRVAVFGDAPEDSGMDPDARRWANWALRGIGSGVGSGVGFPDVGTLAGLSAVGENVRGGMAEFSDFHIRSGFAWAVQAGTLDESGAILSGAGDFANLRTRTTFAGVRWRASFGDKWGGVGTAHFGLAEARSDGALRRGTFRLGAYSAGIGRGDVWRTGDAVMLRLRQPLRAEGGGMFAVFPDGVSGWVDAVPSGRQLDFDAVYRWRFGERADGVFAGTLRRDAGHSRRNSWDGGAMFRVDAGF